MYRSICFNYFVHSVQTDTGATRATTSNVPPPNGRKPRYALLRSAYRRVAAAIG